MKGKNARRNRRDSSAFALSPASFVLAQETESNGARSSAGQAIRTGLSLRYRGVLLVKQFSPSVPSSSSPLAAFPTTLEQPYSTCHRSRHSKNLHLDEIMATVFETAARLPPLAATVAESDASSGKNSLHNEKVGDVESLDSNRIYGAFLTLFLFPCSLLPSALHFCNYSFLLHLV